MKLVIEASGIGRCIYDESFPLESLGEVSIVRASRVEPIPGAQWTANLQPVQGPLLGPFEHRSLALEAELQWLHQYWL